jgi:transcriptional regulator with XRE-family HTH domain
MPVKGSRIDLDADATRFIKQCDAPPVRDRISTNGVVDGLGADFDKLCHGLWATQGFDDLGDWIVHEVTCYSQCVSTSRVFDMLVASEIYPRHALIMQSSAQIVGLRLTVLREALNMKQADMCRATGFATSQWAQHENGTRRLSLDAALKLHDLFGATLDYLFLGDMNGLPVRLAAAMLERPDAKAAGAIAKLPSSEKFSH